MEEVEYNQFVKNYSRKYSFFLAEGAKEIARELRWLLDSLSLTQRLAHPVVSPEAAI
ncbi:hypothetical protein PPOP_1490 [Paenibacillus popilliae ATCC 14706]|uniref:Uncharacterized protein n=1 Tax=Paenibacillus popilliae ATCC 14706 TaxID=1212764 RepID=M9M4D2_PAEPP|nr:hypothetical protein PPOP_1490 [Paenibacillus popilliae ATCC 14706]